MKKLLTPEGLTASCALLLTFATGYRPIETLFIAPSIAQSAIQTGHNKINAASQLAPSGAAVAVEPPLATEEKATSNQANQTRENRESSWWLLLLPLLGGSLWWLVRRSRPAAIAPVAAVPVAAKPLTVAPVSPVTPPVALPITEDLLEEQSPDIKLYEERLVVGKTRQKVGEVIFDKRVETEQAQISTAIKTDRVVIEHNAPTDNPPAILGDVPFGVGEAHIETYEETPDIHKETFVREEVHIRKEIDHETVNAEEILRREQLDIDGQGALALDEQSDFNHSNGHIKGH